MNYRRELSKTEAKRHFVYVTGDSCDFFPDQNEKFKLMVKNETIQASMDSQHRIWASMFYDLLPSFNEGDVVVFIKKSDGSYTVNIE